MKKEKRRNKNYDQKTQTKTWKAWMNHVFKDNEICPICFLNVKPRWNE